MILPTTRFSAAAPVLRGGLLGLTVLAGTFSPACKKEDNRSETEIIAEYLNNTGIANAQLQPSGLYYVPVQANPAGVRAAAGDTVDVLYTGRLMNGAVFDASSRRNNVPIIFILGRGRVIKGWDEGIALMRKGEKAQLIIPSKLAYGSSGSGSIPPNAPIRFEVELVDVR